MTRRIRDCQRCGRAVGKPERDLCARCHWARAHAPDKHRCPDCGADRVLQAGTGRCVRCSRTCRRCDAPVLFIDRDLCKECTRRDRLDAHRVACPRCGKRRILRPTTGWCRSCSHPGRPPNPDAVCVACGQVTRLAGAGRCRTCWARSPHRIVVRADNVAAALNDPPDWLGSFGAYLVGRHHPSRACAMLTRLGKRLADNTTAVHPQTLLESIDADVPLMRALEDFLTANKLALPPDQDELRAAARRQSRIDVVPPPLRPAVANFAAYLLTGRDRARRTGTHPRGHATLEARLGAVRDFAQFLTIHRGKSDWATVDVGDIEALLHARPGRRAYYLAGLRQFCRYAVRRRVMLINPTSGLKAPQTMAFRGPDPSRRPATRAVPAVEHRPRGAPTRGVRRAGRPAARRHHLRTAAPHRRRHRSRFAPHPIGSSSTTRRRWTPGRGPRCNAASATVDHWAATTPTC